MSSEFDLSMLNNNKWVSSSISLMLALYVTVARPALPDFLMRLFENPIFRVAIMAFIVYRGNKDPQLALIVAVAFLFTTNMLTEQKISDGFEQFENMNDLQDENMDDYDDDENFDPNLYNYDENMDNNEVIPYDNN